MSDSFTTLLPDRGVIELRGPDTVSFLQGLVTNDVERLDVGRAMFAGLLTPKGKIICDFLIYRTTDGAFIDVPKAAAADLIKRFSMYRLRAKVDILDRTETLAVGAVVGEDARPMSSPFVTYCLDPRYALLGSRFIAEKSTVRPLADTDGESYRQHRISLAVPQIGEDYMSGDTFPHEACYDALSGVDFRKGCYVGQEIVSRMHHLGTPKTRIAAVTAQAALAANQDILAAGKPIGSLRSTAGPLGVAMIRLDRLREALESGAAPRAGDLDVTVTVPAWAHYDLKRPGDGI